MYIMEDEEARVFISADLPACAPVPLYPSYMKRHTALVPVSVTLAVYINFLFPAKVDDGMVQEVSPVSAVHTFVTFTPAVGACMVRLSVVKRVVPLYTQIRGEEVGRLANEPVPSLQFP